MPFYPYIRIETEIKDVRVLAYQFSELLLNVIEFVGFSLFRCSHIHTHTQLNSDATQFISKIA